MISISTQSLREKVGEKVGGCTSKSQPEFPQKTRSKATVTFEDGSTIFKKCTLGIGG
jgi:hypothetical protein